MFFSIDPVNPRKSPIFIWRFEGISINMLVEWLSKVSTWSRYILLRSFLYIYFSTVHSVYNFWVNPFVIFVRVANSSIFFCIVLYPIYAPRMNHSIPKNAIDRHGWKIIPKRSTDIHKNISILHHVHQIISPMRKRLQKTKKKPRGLPRVVFQ